MPASNVKLFNTLAKLGAAEAVVGAGACLVFGPGLISLSFVGLGLTSWFICRQIAVNMEEKTIGQGHKNLDI